MIDGGERGQRTVGDTTTLMKQLLLARLDTGLSASNFSKTRTLPPHTHAHLKVFFLQRLQLGPELTV